MTQGTSYMEQLTDIRRVIAQFERLPEKAQSYIVGYVEGRAEAQECLTAQLQRESIEKTA